MRRFPPLQQLALYYGFRNAPREGFGALAYGITHPTTDECRDAKFRVFTGQKSVPKILNTNRIGLDSIFILFNPPKATN